MSCLIWLLYEWGKFCLKFILLVGKQRGNGFGYNSRELSADRHVKYDWAFETYSLMVVGIYQIFSGGGHWLTPKNSDTLLCQKLERERDKRWDSITLTKWLLRCLLFLETMWPWHELFSQLLKHISDWIQLTISTALSLNVVHIEEKDMLILHHYPQNILPNVKCSSYWTNVKCSHHSTKAQNAYPILSFEPPCHASCIASSQSACNS